MRHIIVSVLALLLSFSIVGCSKSEKAVAKTPEKITDPMLASVPAETNYFAKIDSKSLEGFKQQGRKALEGYGEYEKKIKEFKESNNAENRFIGVVIESLLTNYFADTMGKVGLSNAPQLMLYGLGIWPAITIEVKDPIAFEAWLSAQEKAAKISAKKETVKQKTFRTYKLDENTISVLSIQKSLATFAVVPNEIKDQLLPYVLGEKRPSKTLNDTDTLTNLTHKYGFKYGNFGFVNIVESFKTLAGQGEGLNKAFLVKDITDAKLDPVCQTEFIGLLKNAPLFVGGLDKSTATATDARFIWALESGLANELLSVVAMTGDGGSADGLASFALAIDSGKGIELFKKKAAALSAAPFKCKELLDTNKEIAKSNGQLMFVPPFARAFRGIQLNVSGITASAVGANIAANLVLSVDNAPAVLEGIKGMLPMLRVLPKLEPNGTPVPLTNVPTPKFVSAPHMALGPKAFGISIGEGEAKRLQKVVTTTSQKASPLFGFSYDFDKIMKALKAAEAANPEAASMVSDYTKMGLQGSSATSLRITKDGLVLTSKQALAPKP